MNSLSGEWGAVLSLREGTGPAAAVASGENNHLIVHNSEKPLSDNKWHMLTLVYDAENDNQQISTYIDGCFSGFNNLAGSSGGFNATDKVQFDQELNWYFGAASQFFFTTTNNGPQYFKGALDDGMLFDRPLSTKEIMKLYIEEIVITHVTIYDTMSVDALKEIDGLVGHWPFNGNAKDESINMNDGIVSGASLTTDRFGAPNSAYSFDGDGDYINLGNDSTLFPSSFSINLWFKYEEAQNSVLLGNLNSLSGEWGAVLSLREGTGPAAAVASGENNHLIVHNSEKPLSDNKWHMLTLVYDAENDNQQISTYIDGCFSGFNNLAGSSGGFNATDKVQFDQELNWYFGAASQFFFTTTNNGPQYFKGALDDGMLFNRPLSSREIIKLFTGEVYFSTVTVYDTINIAVTDTLLIDFVVTSTNNEPELANIKVFPNPTSDIIYIDAQIPNTPTEFNVSIIDNTGRILYQKELSSSILDVNISLLGGKGVYYLEIKDSNGSLRTTKKIILR